MICVWFVSVATATTIETVSVGNRGNTAYPNPWGDIGAVDYDYNIGKYEVTAGQYTDFLNAVAATDTYALYNTSMWTSGFGCKIQRVGDEGSYTYSVAPDWANRPVNLVSWGDAARFANWLHNGQPTGPQDLTTTEDGSYFLNGAMTNAELAAVVRKPDATWVIPTVHEWFKAAHHKNDGVTGNYFEFPTSTDDMPSNLLSDPDPDPGNNATFKVGNQWTIGPPYYRTEAGAHENSASPYGTFDQGGNIYEWTETLVGSENRGVRGGTFNDTVDLLRASRPFVGSLPDQNNLLVGFRVALIPGKMALPGDLNGDGCVNQSDLGILLSDFGCTGGGCAGDIDGDGDTDQADLGILLSNFNQGPNCP
jgi:formylglycine-generating enzyme required for sulfatase activity